MNLRTCAIILTTVAELSDVVAAATSDDILNGNTSYFNGDYAAAETSYTVALNATNWALAYNNRGLARFHQGNYAGATTDFNTAQALDPAYISPFVNKGKCLAAQKQFAAAVTEFQAGLGISSNNVSLLYNLGWVYDEQGQYALALTNYTAALDLDANYHRARLARGITYAKQGIVSNAVADFYGVINGTTAGDMLAAVAAYNLQLLRGPGVNFASSLAATNYLNGIFEFTTEQYGRALDDFAAARTNATTIADVPWMMSWTYLKAKSNDLANAAMEQASTLLNPLAVSSLSAPATIYIDGVTRGSTPTTLYLFPSQYDITLRGLDGTQMVEWAGITYTDGTLGGTNVMVLNPAAITNYTAFAPIVDADRDWLPDSWENNWFGSLNYGPQDDPYGTGLSNLRKFWYSCNPTVSDTDGDGVADSEEISVYGINPAWPNRFYYVNDGSTNNDLWCTAPGNDANNGLSAATPKASVQSVLSNYAFQPGDIVCIDTGTYNLTNNIEVGSAYSGSSSMPVTFGASPYGVTMNRGDFSVGSYAWGIAGTSINVTTFRSSKYPSLPQRWMRVWGGSIGISLGGNNCAIDRCEVIGAASSGIQVWGGTVSHCLIRDCADYGLYSAGGAVVNNCTFVGNQSGVSVGHYDAITLRNNVIMASGVGRVAVRFEGYPNPYVADYNDLYAVNGASVGFDGNYSTNAATLTAWRLRTGQDAHSISHDPLFVNPAAEDYHMQSTAGSYHSGAWTADAATSCGVDTGYGDAGNEPLPNSTPWHRANEGKRNLGAYGGTEQASKTPPGRTLWLYEPIGGENYRDTNTSLAVRWTWVGTGWQSGDTLSLQSSNDGGTTFSAIAGGLGLVDGSYAWSLISAAPSSRYRLRLGCDQAPSVTDQSQQNFGIGPNQPPEISIASVAPVTLPETYAYLNATVTDDGVPSGSLMLLWSMVSGVGSVSFSNPSAASTWASFSTNGTYALQLVASDGLLSATSFVSVVVNARPVITSPPVVTNAFAIVGGSPVVLAGSTNVFSAAATDPDGNSVTCFWDFGDGNSSTTCNPSHAYTDCGSYTVTYNAGDDLATNSDSLAVLVPCELNVTNKGTKVQAKLNFAKIKSDSLSFQTFVNLSAGFNVAGKVITLSFGGEEVAFSLNAKGKGISSPNTCSLKYSKTTGLWIFSSKWKARSCADEWAAHGLTNESIAKPGRPVTLPIILVIGGEPFAADCQLTYTAKLNKSGTAK